MGITVKDNFLNYSLQTNKEDGIFRRRMLPVSDTISLGFQGARLELRDAVYCLLFNRGEKDSSKNIKNNALSQKQRQFISPSSAEAKIRLKKKKAKEEEDEVKYPETLPYLKSPEKLHALIKSVFESFNNDLERGKAELALWIFQVNNLLEHMDVAPQEFSAFDGITDYRSCKRVLRSITADFSLLNFELFLDVLSRIAPRVLPKHLLTRIANEIRQ